MISTKNAEPLRTVDLASSFRQGLEAPARFPGTEAIACAADMLREYTTSGDSGLEVLLVKIAALAQSQRDTISFDESVHDWDLMFCAVEDRLTSAVGKVLVATPGIEPQTAAALVQTIVLECVTALSQLHETLTLERGKRRQMEQEAAHAQGALAGGGLAHASPHAAGNGGFVT